MGWVEIKHAVNSTLGTSDFKPLDKLIEDYFASQYTMIESDDLYFKFAKETLPTFTANTETEINTKFKATRNGNMKIGVDFDLVLNATNNTIRVKRNGEVAEEFTNVGYNAGEKFATIYVKPDDEITFSFISTKGPTSSGKYYAQISIYGKAEPSLLWWE